MLYLLLKFIGYVVVIVAIAFICSYVNRMLGKKDRYRVTYEYQMFVLAKDHVSGSFKFESWEHLKALGADGWEIIQTIDSDYEGISYILKRETFHQS